MRKRKSVFVGTGIVLLILSVPINAADIQWKHLSGGSGDLPVPPGGSNQQTGCVVGDFDNDGVQDFAVSFRQKPPALVWYRRTASGWNPHVIEKEYLTIEAGGAVCDIDADGDSDIVFGGDWQSSNVWWWENPSPHFDPAISWKRHSIKTGGKNQHHDQVFGDFLGTGKPQLVFWNQQAATLFLAEIPADPRSADSWPMTAILADAKPAGVPYIEGASAFDVDADGKTDILACDSWFKHTGGRSFRQIRFALGGGLIFAGYFKPSTYPQIVISPGDAGGRVRLYECTGNPENAADWKAAELLDREVVHGHSLQLADINGDGHLDIFVAEMAQWTGKVDHPEATAWILFGDGAGNFRQTVLVKGHGWHEARVADLDGDGDRDILNKPYTWKTPRIDVWLNNGTRSAAGIGTSPGFRGPVGLQLYSLRHIFKDHVPLGLQMTRDFGFTEIEFGGTYGYPMDTFKAMLAANRLKPAAMMFGYERFEKDLAGIIADCKTFGVSFVGVAWIPHSGDFKESDCRKAADLFNTVGEKLAAEKIAFFYHNHGYEFQPYQGETLFDLLMKLTNPEYVCYEMDVFWTVHPGRDPVALLKKYPNRWKLMHIKDMRKGTRTGILTGSEDVRNDVAIGTGQIDIPSILKTAQEVGVMHYFIEDESPTVVEQIPQSLNYLGRLTW